MKISRRNYWVCGLLTIVFLMVAMMAGREMGIRSSGWPETAMDWIFDIGAIIPYTLFFIFVDKGTSGYNGPPR